MLPRADQDLLDGVTGASGEAQRRAIAKAITLLESRRADHRERADTLELGSTASTATRRPSPMRTRPSVSMNVDLPTPGTPETPSRNDGRAGTGSAVRSASARSR